MLWLSYKDETQKWVDICCEQIFSQDNTKKKQSLLKQLKF